MRYLTVTSAAIALLVVVLLAGCAGSAAAPVPAEVPTQAPAAVPTQAPAPTAASTTATAATGAVTAADKAAATAAGLLAPLADFNPGSFDRSNEISNPWLPLKPGTRLVYEGQSLDDSGKLVPHQITVNVTDLTKLIGGVRSLVTWDEDLQAGQLSESELAFYAQDKTGTVWYMGEYPEAYDKGLLTEAPTWLQGIKGAHAGIMMQASPKTSTPTYSEGWGPAVDWTDVGTVDQAGQNTCVAAGCYQNVLVIAEASASEPNAQQLKYYAQGVGNVRVAWRGSGEKTQETLELTKIMQLTPQDLADVRAKAVALEQNAYATSKDVYAKTAPVEPLPTVNNSRHR